MKDEKKGINVSRRGFMKTAALAGVAATLPVTGIAGQEAAAAISYAGGSRPSPAGKKRTLLFLSGNPDLSAKLIDSIRAIKEYEMNVIAMKADFQKPEELPKIVYEKNPDILFMSLQGILMGSRTIAEALGAMDIPVILIPMSADLIMWETDLAASLRIKGTNALVANSEDHALELIRIMSAPRILEGKKVLVFGRPFDSTSIPSPNLNVNYIYRHTGVRIQHRSIDDLKRLMKGDIDEAAAVKEMERWKKSAAKISNVPDKNLLECSRIYVLLKSIAEKEGFSGVSIDCLSFSFGQDTTIPLPCLAFTRLRDEGIPAACEADICMLLSSMVMQEISSRPSFQCNVSSVDLEASSTVLRHCVAPTKIFGSDAPARPFDLHDYHGMEKGAVPVVEYPVGLDVTMCAYSKDLKDFILWPGRVREGIEDRGTPSFKNAPPEMQKMKKYCSNRVEVKINDIKRFMQSIAGIHHIMVAGSYAKEVYDSMLRMNVNIIAPPDLTPPEV